MSKKSVPILFSLFGSESLADAIHQGQGYELGQIILHQFPDEETVIKIDSVVQDKDVIFIANLAHPNNKLLSLLFAAETARELGAKKVGLIAPYLPYMRQDKRFHPEEGITSKYFARLLSTYFDGLVTVDPHLHRWHGLNDIYTIPTHVLHATDSIAEWIKTNVPDAVLIGPDAESLQWVAGLAKVVGAPFLVLEKIRTGDNEVDVSNPEVDAYRHHTPVLVDDIISTAMTMIETVKKKWSRQIVFSIFQIELISDQ